MKHIKFLITGLFIGGICGAAIFNKCSDTTPNTIVKDSIVYIVDSFPDPYEVKVPEIVYKDTGSIKIVVETDTVEIILPTDTLSIVKDYLTLKYYKLDTSANQIRSNIKWTLYANRMLNYEVSLYNDRETEIITGNGFGVAGLVGYNSFSLGIAYRHKQFQYGAYYDLIQNNIRIGGVWYPDFKKKK